MNFDKLFDFRIEKIQSEFLKASEVFKKHNIKNTVAIFGSARAKADDKYSKKYYEAAYKLSNRIALWSKEKFASNPKEKIYICTGGGEGIMGAANKGAADAGELNLGLRIIIDNERTSNPYSSKDLTVVFNYFFVRKFWLVNLAEAFIIFPGGFGTFDELFEILTLSQNNKMQKTIPFVFFGKSFFNKILNIKMLEKFGYISERDKSLFIITDDLDEAFEHITKNLHPEDNKK